MVMSFVDSSEIDPPPVSIDARVMIVSDMIASCLLASEIEPLMFTVSSPDWPSMIRSAA